MPPVASVRSRRSPDPGSTRCEPIISQEDSSPHKSIRVAGGSTLKAETVNPKVVVGWWTGRGHSLGPQSGVGAVLLSFLRRSHLVRRAGI